jgi:hypothetical protein
MRRALWFLLLLGAACGAPPRGPEVDPELDAATSAARDAFEIGRLVEATRLYELALERARAMDDPRAIGNAAYNLAVCLTAAEELERAAAALAEARLEFTRANHEPGLADVRVVAMRLAYRRGDTDGALELAPDVASIAKFIVLGEIECDRGDLETARAFADSARDFTLSPLDAAHLAHLDGRIARLEKKPAAAGAAFDEEAARLREAKRFGALPASLARAGEAYAAAAMPREAADRLFRAGRSALAQGDRARAAAWAEKAHDAAAAAGDAPLLALCADLRERAR